MDVCLRYFSGFDLLTSYLDLLHHVMYRPIPEFVFHRRPPSCLFLCTRGYIPMTQLLKLLSSMDIAILVHPLFMYTHQRNGKSWGYRWHKTIDWEHKQDASAGRDGFLASMAVASCQEVCVARSQPCAVVSAVASFSRFPPSYILTADYPNIIFHYIPLQCLL